MTVATVNTESVVVYISGNGEVFIKTLSSLSAKQLKECLREPRTFLNNKKTWITLDAQVSSLINIIKKVAARRDTTQNES